MQTLDDAKSLTGKIETSQVDTCTACETGKMTDEYEALDLYAGRNKGEEEKIDDDENLYAGMAQEATAQITGSKEQWTAFLTTSAPALEGRGRGTVHAGADSTQQDSLPRPPSAPGSPAGRRNCRGESS